MAEHDDPKVIDLRKRAAARKKLSVSLAETQEAFLRGYELEAKAIAALPRRFKEGEGVEDIPFDEVD